MKLFCLPNKSLFAQFLRSRTPDSFKFRLASLTVNLLTGATAVLYAQEQVRCPSGEIRIKIDYQQLALNYRGQSIQAAVKGLGSFNLELKIDPKILNEVTEATQQWDEFLKGLVLGWNSCVIDQRQYEELLKQIYPRLRGDAADLEKMKQSLQKGQAIDSTKAQKVIEALSSDLRRFADFDG